MVAFRISRVVRVDVAILLAFVAVVFVATKPNYPHSSATIAMHRRLPSIKTLELQNVLTLYVSCSFASTNESLVIEKSEKKCARLRIDGSVVTKRGLHRIDDDHVVFLNYAKTGPGNKAKVVYSVFDISPMLKDSSITEVTPKLFHDQLFTETDLSCDFERRSVKDKKIYFDDQQLKPLEWGTLRNEAFKCSSEKPIVYDPISEDERIFQLASQYSADMYEVYLAEGEQFIIATRNPMRQQTRYWYVKMDTWTKGTYPFNRAALVHRGCSKCGPKKENNEYILPLFYFKSHDYKINTANKNNNENDNLSTATKGCRPVHTLELLGSLITAAVAAFTL